ncbi:MAG TPA: protein kinase [Streptosporangiaceae bacterium]
MVSGEPPSATSQLAIGSQVAGYQIVEQIGRGGMAVVYRAFDTRLDRSVALKILAPDLARDAAFRQRFLREMRSAAAVDHPHIVPVFDAGDAEGHLYIAMRYVSGQDMRTLLDRERTLPAVRTAHIVTQVASALDEAHSRGLVHRDVKPGNMLLGRVAGSGQSDHVYLSDFGLSKQSLSQVSITSTGEFLGTLDYMAPEQIESRQVDGRADQYSLACSAYEMLAGEPPFRREQGLAVMWAQLSTPAPPLTAKRPDLPPAVDEVMAKALAKTPSDRYRACGDFAEALRAACRIRLDDAVPAAPGPAEPAPTEMAQIRPPSSWPEEETAPTDPNALAEETSPAGPPLRGAASRPAEPAGPASWSAEPAPPASWSAEPAASWSAEPAPPASWSAHQAPPASWPPGQQGPSGPSLRPPDSWPAAPPPVSPGRYPPGGRAAAPRRRGRTAALVIGVIVVLAIAGVAVGLLRSRHAPSAPAAIGSGSASPSVSPTQSGSGPLGPAATVQAYFAAINRHDYSRAWNLGGKNTASSFSQFENGFAGTASDKLTVVSVSGGVVTVKLVATQTDGTVKDFAGTYTVEQGVITGSNIKQTG